MMWGEVGSDTPPPSGDVKARVEGRSYFQKTHGGKKKEKKKKKKKKQRGKGFS